MGTRIYPIAKEGVKINKFVGASDEMMIAFEAFHGKYQRGEIDAETYYEGIYASPTLLELNSFELYGWGKFRALPCMLEEDGYVTPCGTITDPIKVHDLLTINDVNYCEIAHLIDGVCWG